MGLFKKKYDLEKDHLRIEFSLDDRKYIIFLGQNRIQYDDLSAKTKKILDNKNNSLKTDSNLLNEEINNSKKKSRFNKLKSLGYTNFGFEYLGPVEGTMSPKMANFLGQLTNEENVLIGINRVGMNINEERIQDTFENGLPITGHYVAKTASAQLSQNVGYYVDNKTIIKELMYVDTYKNSKGAFLIRIPDNDLKGDIFIRDENNSIRLKPEYIIGYVPAYPNHHIEDIIMNNHRDERYSYVFCGENITNDDLSYDENYTRQSFRK